MGGCRYAESYCLPNIIIYIYIIILALVSVITALGLALCGKTSHREGEERKGRPKGFIASSHRGRDLLLT